MFVQIMAFARIIGHVLKTGRYVDVSAEKFTYYNKNFIMLYLLEKLLRFSSYF